MQQETSVTFRNHTFHVWNSTHYLFRDERRDFVHLFGEMDLPLTATYDEALSVAVNAAECCGYLVKRSGQNAMVCYGDSVAFRVTYQDGRMTDIESRTLQTRIENLVSWNQTWLERIRDIEIHGPEKPGPYPPGAQERGADYYQAAIDANNETIITLQQQIEDSQR